MNPQETQPNSLANPVQARADKAAAALSFATSLSQHLQGRHPQTNPQMMQGQQMQPEQDDQDEQEEQQKFDQIIQALQQLDKKIDGVKTELVQDINQALAEEDKNEPQE